MLCARLALRGGGKGGCKAKHLSGKGRSRHFLVTKHKHAFPNLRLGAAHAVASGANSSLVPTGARAQDKRPYRATGPEDSDSYSSWEAEEEYARFQQRLTTDRAPPPAAGLIPLTSKGAREFGAVELASSYMGRPIQILRRARDPRDGDVWGWGANYDGQLGIANGCRMDRWQPTRQLFMPDGAVAALAAGEAHSLVLRDDGGVLACGLNAHGQLGDGSRETRREPVLVTFPALDHAPRAVAIAAGATHSLAVLESGDLLAWGCNTSAQLGPGPPLDPMHHLEALRENLGLQPGQVSDADMLLLWEALADDVPRKLPQALTAVPVRRRRKAWLKAAAAAAVLSPVLIRLPPQPDGSRICVAAVAGGPSFSLAASKEGLVYQWGHLPWQGTPGEGAALEGVHLVQGLSGNVVGVAAGRAHALAVTADGQVWAWGSNEAGQLGVAPRADAEGTPVLVVGEGASGIAAGGDVSACCLANGTLLVWGLDSHPRAVAAAAREEMQDDGSPSALGWEPQTVGRLGTARIVSVAVGGDGRVLARDEAGAVFAWGANDRGQCGFKGKRLRPSQKARASSAAGASGAKRFVEWGEKLQMQLHGKTLPAPTATPHPASGKTVATAANATTYAGGIIVGGERRPLAPYAWQGKGVEDGPAARVAGPVMVPRLPRPVVAVAAGMNHALAITRV